MKVCYIPSHLQRADIYTKAVPRERFKDLCAMLNLTNRCVKHLSGGNVKLKTRSDLKLGALHAMHENAKKAARAHEPARAC